MASWLQLVGISGFLVGGGCGGIAPAAPDGAPVTPDARPDAAPVDAVPPDAAVTGDPYLGADGDYVEAWHIDPVAQTFQVTLTGRPGIPSAPIVLAGTIASYPSGFQRFTVTTASDPAYPVDGTGSYLAIGPIGGGYVIEPAPAIGGSPRLLAPEGACDAQLGTFGYLVVAPSVGGFTPETVGAYGAVTLSGGPGSVAVAGTARSLDCLASGCTVDGALEPPPPGACSQGRTTFPDGTAGAIAGGGDGALLVSLDQTTQLLGFREDPSLAIDDVTAHGYAGFAVTATAHAPATVDFGTGAQALARFVDPVTGEAMPAGAVALQFDAAVVNGRVTGTATSSQHQTTPFVGIARHFGSHIYLDVLTFSALEHTPVYLLLVSRG